MSIPFLFPRLFYIQDFFAEIQPLSHLILHRFLLYSNERFSPLLLIILPLQKLSISPLK